MKNLIELLYSLNVMSVVNVVKMACKPFKLYRHLELKVMKQIELRVYGGGSENGCSMVFLSSKITLVLNLN